ncbi:hypothetical protein HAZT_HAZT012071 [Hyalella azteca]|uniref:Retinol dehydrogenase 14 n=1 Tax=Hyalella azteca TaxID=294128 RepID=A0A6A0GY44_HYAAZ|nr:retinol dehydrogenase 14 [Hyalella azteca]KAA0192689.1 hypothetical protein HAZT_HAZT012071 [Hyalella azteca]
MSGAPSRVINVSSSSYVGRQLDLGDLNFDRRRYFYFRAYSQSKLANILFTKELARRLKGTGVVTNAVDPGLVYTEINGRPNQSMICRFLDSTRSIIARTESQGAQTQLYLALSEEGGVESGSYYVNCRKERLWGNASDMNLAKKLWEVSCKNVQLAQEEMIPDAEENSSNANTTKRNARKNINTS